MNKKELETKFAKLFDALCLSCETSKSLVQSYVERNSFSSAARCWTEANTLKIVLIGLKEDFQEILKNKEVPKW